MPRHDVVVVGGGHNGLAAAAYLARSGRSVLVLERRDVLGGAVASDRPWPAHDVRVSRFSYLVSLLHPVVARELGVRVVLADRPVAACAPSPRGTLLLGDEALTRRSLRALTGDHRAHAQLGAWDADVAAAAAGLWPTFVGPVPSRAEALRRLGPLRALASEPLGALLAERLDDPLLRGTVATDGLIGTFAGLDDPSLVQNRCFLYHVVGGPWRVPVGGMGQIALALETAARQAGAELRCGADVLDVDGPSGTVTWQEGGAEHAVTAGRVLLGCVPGTGRRLAASTPLAPEGAQLKLNLLLSRLPALRDGTPPEVAFGGTFRVHESVEELDAAYVQAARGEVPARPPAELYCHTLTDPSILGDGLRASGAHTLTAFVLHAPARLFTRAGAKEQLVERVLDGLDAHVGEPVRPLLLELEAKTPQELEAELGMPGGHIFHGDLAWPWDEPRDGAPGGRWGVATEHERVLVCGAGARRGGGVSGLGGRDAAMAVLGR